VHLGKTIYKWRRPEGGATFTIPLWRSNAVDGGFRYKDFAKNLVEVAPDTDGIITIRPNTFYLADLLQFTSLPPDLAMHIEGKSTLARLGLAVHITAPHAHAGWVGRLTLEMFNLGPFNIELKPGAPVGQLTFWRVENPLAAEEIKAKTFTGQQKATGAGSERTG
jgi:dCTP deaminase